MNGNRSLALSVELSLLSLLQELSVITLAPCRSNYQLLLQAVELMAFSTAILSMLAAVVRLISTQLVVIDGHVPTCAAGDQSCAEAYNRVVIT